MLLNVRENENVSDIVNCIFKQFCVKSIKFKAKFKHLIVGS